MECTNCNGTDMYYDISRTCHVCEDCGEGLSEGFGLEIDNLFDDIDLEEF